MDEQAHGTSAAAAAATGNGGGGGGARRRFVEDYLTPYNAYSATHTLQLVQQWLHEHDYVQALAALESESGVSYTAEGLQRSGQLASILTEHHELQLAMQGEDEARKTHLEELLAGGNGRFVNSMSASLDNLHPGKPVLAVAFSPDPEKTWLATGSADKTIRITDYESHAHIATFDHHQAGVISIAFSPVQPDQLLSGSMDGTASLVSVASSSVQQRFSDHRKYVVCTAWHPEGRYFATGSYDHTVCLYEKSSSSAAGAGAAGVFQLKKQFLFASNVESIHFTLDGKLLLVAAREDNYLHCVDMDTLTEWKLNMNANQDDHVSFSALHVTSDAASKYLLVATDKNRNIMFSLADSQQVRNFYGSSNDVFSQPRIAFDPTAKYVYCTAQDQKVHVYDVASEKLLHKNAGHSATIRDMHHHPRENCLATASFDRTVKLWTHAEQD